MLEEKEEVTPEVTPVVTPVAPEKVFKDFINSKDYIDHINMVKGQWKENLIRDEKETPDQATIRELMEWKTKAEADKQLTVKQAELRAKAKEIGFDVTKADRYAAYGDDAEIQMIADNEYLKTSINTALEKQIKGSFDTKIPAKPSIDGQKMTMEQTKGMSSPEIRDLIDKGLIEGL